MFSNILKQNSHDSVAV